MTTITSTQVNPRIEHPPSMTQVATLNDLTPGQTDRPGISGKKLTLAILALLIFMGGSLAYFLALYDRRSALRMESARHWRVVASQLDQDYRRLAESELSTSRLDRARNDQFIKLADHFRTALSIEDQLDSVLAIEQLFHADPATAELLSPITGQALEELHQYNRNVAVENQLYQSWGGRVLQVLLAVRQRLPWQPIDQ